MNHLRAGAVNLSYGELAASDVPEVSSCNF